MNNTSIIRVRINYAEIIFPSLSISEKRKIEFNSIRINIQSKIRERYGIDIHQCINNPKMPYVFK